MTIAELVRAMESIAPTRYAAPWDNVGLLVGEGGEALAGPVLLTIDLTDAVLEEATRAKASCVVAYHPPIFHPLRRLAEGERTILRAARAGLAVYSPHTALDAAPGGLTDWLCEGISGGVGAIAGDCRALEPHACCPENEQVKIATFVPEAECDRVREALASAGAGIIGAYRLCSFAVHGMGTFFGGAGAAPAVGQAGRLERVQELRLEMVCSRAALPLAIETLRRFHPYEEPAFDVYALVGKPERSAGMGRRLVLDRAARPSEIAGRLKAFLGIPGVHLALAGPDEPITHLGACPGAGASLADAARADGCALYVTGEMKHHEVLAAVRAGQSVILAGHTNTERGYLPRLRDRLADDLRGVEVIVSAADRDPAVWT